MASSEIDVVKYEEKELPIPSSWRPVFKNIVKAFVAHDYHLSYGVQGVQPISDETADQIKNYISDYGEELVELPSETWESSAYIWMGKHWDVLIDLWTAGEGRSDLVLSAQVSESSNSYSFQVYMVYVP